MFNIQKAVSRLNFAPKLNGIEITDIKNGIGVFTPKADKPVSFQALKEALKKAGYTLASAKITVNGKLARDASGWTLLSDTSGQRFALEGEGVDLALPDAAPNAQVEITGDWKTAGEGKEVISPLPAKKAERSHNENVDDLRRYRIRRRNERRPSGGGAIAGRAHKDNEPGADCLSRRRIHSSLHLYEATTR